MYKCECNKQARKILKITVIAALTILCLCTAASAKDNKIQESILDISLTDKLSRALPSENLPEEVSELAKNPSGSINLFDSLKSVLSSSLSSVSQDLKSALKQAVYMFAVAALCGILAPFAGKDETLTLSPVSLCAAAAIAVPGIGQLSSSINLCESAVSQMCVFSKTLFPSIAAACGISGSPSSGIVTSAAALAVTGIVMSVLKNLFFPAIYLYITAVMADAAVENELIKKAAGFIKFALTECMKWTIFLYLSYSGIGAIISSTADVSAIKTAKMAISGSIPVIGSIVSDSAGVILSGAAMIKNSIGLIGIVSVAAICLIPFLRIGMYYLSYKLCSAFCALIAPKQVTALTDGIGTAFGMSTALVGTVAVLLFISITLSVIIVRPV